MATLRLTDTLSARFIVRDEKEQTDIFNIDLIKYLNLMKLDEYADMPLQEYLDRENSYQIILVTGKDNSGKRIMLSVRINNWTLVLNSTEL